MFKLVLKIIDNFKLKAVVIKFTCLAQLIRTSVFKSNSNGSHKKWGAKCNFATMNSVLVPLNSVLSLMVGIKIRYHFNNSMFLIKKYN